MFLTVSVIVTVAAVTASFVFWSFVPVQPGTATALVTLFLVAPGTGIAAGIWMAIKAGQQRPGVWPSSGKSDHAWRFLMAGLAALVGAFAGYGACKAAIDLTYTDRWSNPDTAPSWLPVAPYLAAAVLALVLAVLVLIRGSRPRGRLTS